MEGNKWSEIFGENGFLNLAAQLVAEITDAQYIVMPLDQIIAYAAIKLSQVRIIMILSPPYNQDMTVRCSDIFNKCSLFFLYC